MFYRVWRNFLVQKMFIKSWLFLNDNSRFSPFWHEYKLVQFGNQDGLKKKINQNIHLLKIVQHIFICHLWHNHKMLCHVKIEIYYRLCQWNTIIPYKNTFFFTLSQQIANMFKNIHNIKLVITLFELQLERRVNQTH